MFSMCSRRLRVLLGGCLLALASSADDSAHAADRSLPSPEQIQSIYREALGLWSSGRPDEAVAMLVEMETAAISDDDIATRTLVHKAEQKVISDVAGNDIEVLLPLAVFHQDVYRRYAERGGRGLALALSHSKDLAIDLARLYRKHSSNLDAPRLSSLLFVRLARSIADPLLASRMLQEAIDIDPQNISALLGMASLCEKAAQYESAESFLVRLLEIDPRHGEGQLRMALIRERRGDRKEGVARLVKLLDGGGATWVDLLAAQELARIYLLDGDAVKAEEVVRKGMERFPSFARLRIVLAAALDRRGDVLGARSELEAMAEMGADASDDSRYRYNRLNPELFAEAERVISEVGASRLPVLAQALSIPSSGGEVAR